MPRKETIMVHDFGLCRLISAGDQWDYKGPIMDNGHDKVEG